MTFYAGYDPTSPSLHVGNLVPVIMQARLQRAGHKPIVVVGGATGMVGDPSGKSAERNLLGDDELAANRRRHPLAARAFPRFRPGPTGAVLVNNADWTRGVGYLEFLRDVGKHLTINYMMAKDSVRARLEGDTGISYTEFSYMLLQAFDFVHLSRAPRLSPAGRRLGPVRQHHGGLRAVAQDGRPAALRPHRAAAARLDRARRWARPRRASESGSTPSARRPYAFYQYFFNVTDEDAPAPAEVCSRCGRSPSSTSSPAATTQTAANGSRSASSRAS